MTAEITSTTTTETTSPSAPIMVPVSAKSTTSTTTSIATITTHVMTYLYATAITTGCAYFMFEGKLDVSVGIGIISTMGLGSLINRSNHHAIECAMALQPPTPACEDDGK